MEEVQFASFENFWKNL